MVISSNSRTQENPRRRMLLKNAKLPDFLRGIFPMLIVCLVILTQPCQADEAEPGLARQDNSTGYSSETVNEAFQDIEPRVKDHGVAGKVVAEKVSESPTIEVLAQGTAESVEGGDPLASGADLPKSPNGFYGPEVAGNMEYMEASGYPGGSQLSFNQQLPQYPQHQQQHFQFAPQQPYPAYEDFFQRSNGNYAGQPGGGYTIASKPNNLSPVESSSLNILYQDGVLQSERRRPTLHNLSPSEAVTVNTPQELLDYCCRFPACYDPLFDLCIDTCRKCETEYPVTSWLPCPPLLNIPDCTSDSLSKLGRLPLACFPDIGPFANIMPLSSVMTVPMAFQVMYYFISKI